MKNSKHFVFVFLSAAIMCILLISCTIYFIDPYFVYHKPKDKFVYSLDNERYQNYGILRNFDYEAAIIGTSMCQNFKTSEFESIFGMKAVKTCNAGASFKENGDMIKSTIAKRDDVKEVLWGLDTNYIIEESDSMHHTGQPYYLYDESFVNDINYLLNMDVFLRCFLLKGNNLSFDEYSYWGDSYSYGINNFNPEYNRKLTKEKETVLSDYEKQIIFENLTENIIKTVKECKKTHFDIFFTPYSICFFDEMKQNGELSKIIEALKLTSEALMKESNVSVYCFFDEYELISNLNNYRDEHHYHPKVNSYILESINKKNHLLTESNYEEYFKDIEVFYSNYEYDSLFN